MTLRDLLLSVSSVVYLAISVRNLLRHQADWIQNFAGGSVLLLGLAAVFFEWRRRRGFRRESLRAKFSKMARHDNAR